MKALRFVFALTFLSGCATTRGSQLYRSADTVKAGAYIGAIGGPLAVECFQSCEELGCVLCGVFVPVHIATIIGLGFFVSPLSAVYYFGASTAYGIVRNSRE